jgi:hypothetical protein
VKRICEWCKDRTGKSAKIVKLKKPEEVREAMAGGIYDRVITHRCEQCGCSFGEAKPVKVEVNDY